MKWIVSAMCVSVAAVAITLVICGHPWLGFWLAFLGIGGITIRPAPSTQEGDG